MMVTIGLPDKLAVPGNADIAIVDGRGELQRSGYFVFVVPVPIYRITKMRVIKIEERQQVQSDTVCPSQQLRIPPSFHAIGMTTGPLAYFDVRNREASLVFGSPIRVDRRQWNQSTSPPNEAAIHLIAHR
ncbi:MAG: hypothetical protein WBF17_01710 [Phycisphaerae bacterium]